MTIVLAANPFDWNNLVQLLLAAIVAWTAYRVEQRKKDAKAEEDKRELDRVKLEQVAATVKTVAEQTDGINKALVVAEKAASKDEGKKEERAEVAERAQVAEDKAASKNIQLPPHVV